MQVLPRPATRPHNDRVEINGVTPPTLVLPSQILLELILQADLRQSKNHGYFRRHHPVIFHPERKLGLKTIVTNKINPGKMILLKLYL